MDCCLSDSDVCYVHESCDPVEGSPGHIKFILSNIHKNFYRAYEGHAVSFEIFVDDSVEFFFPLDSSVFMNIRCTREKLYQIGLDSNCVDKISQQIHALCKNAVHSIAIWIHISTYKIFCQRCYTERIMEEAVLNGDDDYVMIPACKSAIDELKMNEETCNGESDEGCTICLEKFQNEERVVCMPCTHVFHSCCIEKWLQHSHYCPLCRFELATQVE